MIEGDLREGRNQVRDQHLLRKTDDKDPRADRGAAQRRAPDVELPRDRLVADDRPRDELYGKGEM